MSRQKIKNKLEDFEKRLKIDGQTFTREEVLRYYRVLSHIVGAVEHAAEREVLKNFTHNEYVIWNTISVKILERRMKPPYDTPEKYAKQHWPDFWDKGGIYDLWMRGEETGAHPTL